MRRVVVEGAAAGGPLAAPRVALRTKHDRPVRLGEHVTDPPDGVEVEQAPHLAERADESVVIADLGDQARRSRRRPPVPSTRRRSG